MLLNEHVEPHSASDENISDGNDHNSPRHTKQRGNKRLARVVKLCALGCLILPAGFWLAKEVSERGQAIAQTDLQQPAFFEVQPTNLTHHLTVVGTIRAHNSSILFAPFDGLTRTVHATVGSSVKAGAILAVIDTADIAAESRAAEADFIKARGVVQSLKDWRASADYQRSLRALLLAEAELLNLQKQTDILADLLNRGIVPRNEYEASQRQVSRQILNVESQQQDLRQLEQASQGQSVNLAELELKNAGDRFERLKALKENATVKASKDGILVSLPSVSDGGQRTMTIEAGLQLKKGQPIFAIADSRVFIAEGQIDENDVSKIRVGQTVEISSEAFPDHKFEGEIARVSSEAFGSASGRQRPAFQVQARFELKDNMPAQSVRLGMSSRIKIKTYQKSDAIVVPLEAISHDNDSPYITVRQNELSVIEQRNVELGATTVYGIEVTKGLSAGETIIMPD
ncbi:Macrolide export protein MacA [Pseudovibrio sp. Ad46]|nr:Macrolide export protein MacA [Pseudovibrio sp. Ad46]KZL19218.1 Macrolide export protein MacA [Pseudovibrio sp. Ad37]KZL23333.1 Macrolide export protein MacA [Pseudovibrio sp. WM33]